MLGILETISFLEFSPVLTEGSVVFAVKLIRLSSSIRYSETCYSNLTISPSSNALIVKYCDT